MNKLDLIKMAVDEYYLNKLTAEQVIFNISTILNIKNPSEKTIKWAEESIKNRKE